MGRSGPIHNDLRAHWKYHQIPRIAVREALRAGRLIEVLPGYRAEPLSLSLVYPQRRELSRRVNLFMQWLAGVMKEHLD